jgi:hypothetical protein
LAQSGRNHQEHLATRDHQLYFLFARAYRLSVVYVQETIDTQAERQLHLSLYKPQRQRLMEIDLAWDTARRLKVIGGDIVGALDDANLNGIHEHGQSPRLIIRTDCLTGCPRLPVAERSHTMPAEFHLLHLKNS